MSLELARVRTLRRQAIRPLTPDDVDAVAAVLQQVFGTDSPAAPARLADYVRRAADKPPLDPKAPSP